MGYSVFNSEVLEDTIELSPEQLKEIKSFNKQIEKAKLLSKAYYNKAYFYAKSGEITKAIETVQKSLFVNSADETARLLLGLLQYEIGEISDALINFSLVSKNASKNIVKNMADEYIKILVEDRQDLENQNEAILLYNKALKFCNVYRYDFAVVALKKSVKYNENFICAKNLLALVYIKQKEYDLAMPIVSEVLKKDIGNEKALYYKDFLEKAFRQKECVLNEETRISEISKSYEKRVLENKNIQTSDNIIWLKNNKRIVLNTVSVFFAVVCVVSIINNYANPKEASAQKSRSISSEIINQKTAYDKKIEEKDLLIDELNEKIEELKNTNLELQNNTSSMKITQNLKLAKSLNDSEKYLESAKIIKELENDRGALNNDEIVLFDELKGTVYLNSANLLYAEGYADFLAKDYLNAKNQITASLDFGLPHKTEGDAYFILGEIARKTGDTNKAMSYYEKCVNNFEGSPKYMQAVLNLNELREK